MADQASVERRIAALFETHINVRVSSAETDLFESGVLDSLAFVDLLVELEEEFGVESSVDDLEIENFRSIASIARFVTQRHRLNAADGHGRASRPS
jgi:acyl carrier protein